MKKIIIKDELTKTQIKNKVENRLDRLFYKIKKPTVSTPTGYYYIIYGIKYLFRKIFGKVKTVLSIDLKWFLIIIYIAFFVLTLLVSRINAPTTINFSGDNVYQMVAEWNGKVTNAALLTVYAIFLLIYRFSHLTMRTKPQGKFY